MIVVIEKEPGTVPEGMVATEIDKIGYHGFRTYNLVLTDVRVPLDARVGPTSGGPAQDGEAVSAFRATQELLNEARVHTAARAVGLARGAVEDCTTYLQEREQFGQPLAEFQALRFKLAEMAARVEQARVFVQNVAHRLDQGEPCEKESAMVKLLATEMAAEVTGEGIQLHGGNGYTTERNVERYWRDGAPHHHLRRHQPDPTTHHRRTAPRQSPPMNAGQRLVEELGGAARQAAPSPRRT